MLRGFVLLFVAINVGLYFWIGQDPRWGQSEREPERLDRQVSPEAIQVVPDVAASTLLGAAASQPGRESAPASAAIAPL